MGKLDGKVVIVTGAGRGIGREIAAALASEGAHTALASRTFSQLEETRKRIEGAGGRAIAIETDVTDERAVAELVRKTEEELGSVNVLMNNAGSFNAIGPVTEVDPEVWWRDVTVNLLGPFLCCRAVLPGMVGRGSGTIINMIGGGTAGPFPYGTGYGSSKAALMRFTESLDREVHEDGVVVFAMGPGLVRTAMTELQLATEAGKRWMGAIAEMFEQSRDVPPTRAAALAVALASGRFDELHGRAFGVRDDLEDLLAAGLEIIDRDLMTLRMREFHG